MKSGSTRQKADHLETFSAIRLAEMCAKNIVLDASGSYFFYYHHYYYYYFTK